MALRRVFVESVVENRASVKGPKARHLRQVARLRPGELVELSDTQRLYLAEVKSFGKAEIAFGIREELESPRRRAQITVGLAIFRFQRMELAIEKATELGADVITPIAAFYSDRGLVKAAVKRRERWRRIAEEAAGQSRRLAPPRVEEPASFEEALSEWDADVRIFLDTGGPLLKDALREELGKKQAPARAVLLIGPEGGWSDDERAMAQAQGYRAASLGPEILRAETAAVAALSIFAHWLER